MVIETDAWVLRAGPKPAAAGPVPGQLERDRVRIPDLDDHEVLVEPLYGSWEANLNHAIARSPIDVCHQRGEDQVVLGNAGVVRVLRPGNGVTTLTEGDVCLLMPFGQLDRHGYVELAYAYDAPGTYGLLARRTKFPAEVLLPLPATTRYPLHQWATYGRYFTAWDNWRVTYACWRAQLPDEDPAGHLVFGWGGGVALAELELARQAGFTVAMTASRDDRLRLLAEHGIIPVDRREFTGLADGDDVPGGRDRRRAAQGAFLTRIGELSGGRGVSMFLDNIGGPLYRTVIRSLSRQGVVSTVGWKAGMDLSYKRASECINRHLHVNTHVWRQQDCPTIRDLCESSGWLAEVDRAGVYAFDDVPQLAADYGADKLDTYFPLYSVNDETPSA
ncbi:MAG: zinc-binding dehydrogenase [Actinocatenispora sp.]